MKVAVIGAGWAGLSAALHLHRLGHAVSVFEAAHILGGRARRTHSARLNASIDNGQHILLGAYTETLELMQSLGLSVEDAFYRQPLTLLSADGRFSLKAGNLPAPLHLLTGIIGARGLSVTERLRLIAINRQLQRQRWTTAPDMTVAQWLRQGGQSEHIVRRFWQPLCLAALNTPVEQASAQLLATVLRDSLGGPKSASSILIPRVDLSSLWPEHLPHAIAVHRGHPVRSLASHATHIELDGLPFDAAIVATNTPSALRLLSRLKPVTGADAYLAALAAFEFIPIATLTLQLARPWCLPHAMLMLNDAPASCQFGQWLFDRSVFMQDQTRAENHALNIVISDARALARHSTGDIVAGVLQQIREQTPQWGLMPEVLGHELIIEKRATFAAVPGLQRPDNRSPWSRIAVAGDWTDTGYPGVLEGAARSGGQAARLIDQSVGQSA